jgi:AcrR family transcriptional regulator
MVGAASHDERRAEIAEATWRVIERRGVEGASVRDIAREGGYSTGVLSHYFRGKRELLEFSYRLMVEREVEGMSCKLREEGLLGAFAELLPLDERRRRNAVVSFALFGSALRDPELSGMLHRRHAEAQQALMPMMRAAFGWGADEKGLAEAADELMIAVDGISLEALADPDRFGPERQLALLRRAVERLDLPTGKASSSG